MASIPTRRVQQDRYVCADGRFSHSALVNSERKQHCICNAVAAGSQVRECQCIDESQQARSCGTDEPVAEIVPEAYKRGLGATYSSVKAGGKHGERLNLLTDTLGGPYDAILAICVLIHVERAATDRVLRKIRRALRPGGVFLTAVWAGSGQTDGRYHMTYWSRPAFAARLTAAGLKVEWESRRVARGGKTLLTFLARRLP